MNSEGDDYEGTETGGLEMEGGIMPPPWERHLSEDDEQFYYYNPETGECLWEADLLEFLADEEFQNTNDDGDIRDDEYSNGDGDGVGQEAEDYDDDHVDQQRNDRYDPLDDEDAPPPPPPDEDIDGLDLLALANVNVASSQASTSVYSGISDPSLSVVDRSKRTMQAKQQKINSLHQSREREQLRAQTSIPVTTRKAKSMQRSVEDMLQWEEERRQRLHRTKATLRAQEEAEVTGRPMLTKKAEEVSRRWREGGGDDGQSMADGQASVVSSARSVQDRLYEYEERKKEKMERLQAERDAAIRSSAIPRINPMSNKILERKTHYYGGDAASVAGATSLGGESHVSERLYALAQLKQQTDTTTAANDATGPGSFLAQGRLTQHDPSTGQRYFEPRLNPVSEAMAARRRQQLRHLKIEDVLHAQGQQYQRKMAEKEARRRQLEEQKRKTSKVNALSAKIVEDKYIVSGETTQDRLARGIGTVRRRVLDTIDQPTFKPKISESSLEILASSGYRHLYFQQQQQQEAEAEAERRQRWQAAQELSFGGGGYGYGYDGYGGDVDGAAGGGGGAVMVEAGQVTLDPRVSATGGGSVANSSAHGGSTGSGPGNAVYERSRLWEQQRQRRLERDRHEAERREREICSFRPKVSAASAQLAAKGDIATRHQRWQQERDARLQSERQRQSVDEVKDCTFVPRVPVPPKSVAQKVAATRVPLVSPSSPSRSVENSSGHSGGHSGHGSSHSQGHGSQSSTQQHFGFEDFATPYTAFLPKSPTAAGHKTVAASTTQTQSSASAAVAASGVRFRTKSASELLASKTPMTLASPSDDHQRYADHEAAYSAPPTSTHRGSQGPPPASSSSVSTSQFSFAEFPPSQLRYGASHHPPVAPPTTAPSAVAPHWQQYYPHNAQLRELDEDDDHGALDYAADMTSLEQLAQLSLRQERQQLHHLHHPQHQQLQQQHQQQQQYLPPSQVAYGYQSTRPQQRSAPHLMYHHDHDDAHSAAFDPEDML